MVVIKTATILISFLILFSFNADSFFIADSSGPNQQTQSGKSVTATARIIPPDFEVLDEQSYDSMTLFQGNEAPKKYEGALVRLKSDDVAYISKAIKNLGVQKVFVYRGDEEISEKLTASGIKAAFLD
ncbi:hypothetical protein J4212_00335 [Candidatus Woesearchaeota archaeon]|nr:hypothetical protein [Candidatus Woesearchaeota archaeon]